jgi:hypothetical protein
VKDDKTVIKISDLETLDDPSVPGRKINWLQSSAVERHDCLESVALPVIEAIRSNVILKRFLFFKLLPSHFSNLPLNTRLKKRSTWLLLFLLLILIPQ